MYIPNSNFLAQFGGKIGEVQHFFEVKKGKSFVMRRYTHFFLICAQGGFICQMIGKNQVRDLLFWPEWTDFEKFWNFFESPTEILFVLTKIRKIEA